jgi:hypothetical protein
MNPISFFCSRQIAIRVFLVVAFMQANSFIGLAEAVDFKVSSADELQAALAKVQV